MTVRRSPSSLALAVMLALVPASLADAQTLPARRSLAGGASSAIAAQGPAAGDSQFPFASVEVRGGITQPAISVAGASSAWEPGAAAVFGMNFGLRPARYVQFDIGFDLIPRAFDASGSISTTGGTRAITDLETIFLMGTRLVIPSADDRILLSVGGGYAYAHYGEMAATQGREVIVGFEGGKRTGEGVYFFGQLEAAPSVTSPVTFGVRVGAAVATTNGATVGRFPGHIETDDRWPSVVGTLSFRFGR
jgi:hypothetical protein